MPYLAYSYNLEKIYIKIIEHLDNIIIQMFNNFNVNGYFAWGSVVVAFEEITAHGYSNCFISGNINLLYSQCKK